MLFANGYRYHMRNIGCPVSLDGYGVASGHFGGSVRHSFSSGCFYNSHRPNCLSWSQRPSLSSSNYRRSRCQAANRRRATNSNNGNYRVCYRNSLDDLNVSCGAFFKGLCDKNTDSSNNGNCNGLSRASIVLISKKCIVSMKSILGILLMLGIMSTVMGGIYFQRNSHAYNFKSNFYQLLCIIALIFGIIMLLSSGVLFRVIFSGSKFTNHHHHHHHYGARSPMVTGSPIANQHSVPVTSESNCAQPLNSATNVNNENTTNNSTNHLNSDQHSRDLPRPLNTDTPAVTSANNINIPATPSNNDDDDTNTNATNNEVTHTNDQPPTYIECTTNSTTPVIYPPHYYCQYHHDDSVTPPPKYSTEPPPSYSQLDVRTLVTSSACYYAEGIECHHHGNHCTNGISEEPMSCQEHNESPSNDIGEQDSSNNDGVDHNNYNSNNTTNTSTTNNNSNNRTRTQNQFLFIEHFKPC